MKREQIENKLKELQNELDEGNLSTEEVIAINKVIVVLEKALRKKK